MCVSRPRRRRSLYVMDSKNTVIFIHSQLLQHYNANFYNALPVCVCVCVCVREREGGYNPGSQDELLLLCHAG